MHRLRLALAPLLLALLACLSSGRQAPPTSETLPAADDSAAQARRVTELADAYLAAYLRQFPEAAAYNALPGTRYDRFNDNSPSSLRAWEATEDEVAARLSTIKEDSLWNRPEWVTWGFLREALDASRGLRVCRNELWQVNQLTGWQAGFATLAGIQPVTTPELREQAIARWSSLPRYVDTEIANLREGVRLGYTVPRRNAELVLEQLDELAAMPRDQLPFLSPGQRTGDAEFLKRWQTLVTEQIRPAIERYRTYLRNEYLPAARTTIAVSDLPDGARCYAATLRYYTSLDRPPREVFAAGQRAVAARQAALQELGQRIFGTSDLAAIRDRLRSDRSNDFSSRDEALAVTKDAVERARQEVPQWFGKVPRAGVSIEPLPAYQEKGSYSQYFSGAEDGSRPGIYQINLGQSEGSDRGASLVTAFHETYPGHHMQLALAQERPAAHPITRLLGNSGFIEGWGRYAETLADEMGLYGEDRNRLSHLSGMPTGMVVDPAIHALGWTRQQAIDYVVTIQAGMNEAAAGRYVDRIAVLPGQMATYGVGEQEILALREEARQALGPRFDIREFHDRVLENGSVTLGMLRQRIERWIAEKQKSK
ncbi:MAG TPA: DUF885 domain-containing protein [Thermoanaerobaculia bacterium]|nr:DUF885 domain-containing protein [Thermoanaerobaculia bacterium]